MSLFPAGFAPQEGGYAIEDSLRLRSSATAYLSRTPASASNRKTWTWSAWVKRGNLSANQTLFTAGNGTYDSRTEIVLDANDYLYMVSDHRSAGGTWYGFNTLARFRDPSAWYHIVVIWDTTQSTDTNRLKGYINNIQYTFNVQNVWMPQNFDGYVNSTSNHYIGKTNHNGVTHWLDGYLTEINFIDGQALDPSYFGQTDDVTGVWKPKKYTGTYGTNGFYLPMTPTSQAEGFNTVLYTGTGATQSITGVGFAPDFVWIKTRNNVASHSIFDGIRGVNNWLASDSPDAAFGGQTDLLTSFGSDGFSLGANTGSKTVNKSGQNFVAWCWDAGSGSPASNTDGTITSTVKANQAKGFSIVSYTGTGSNATVGHGLGTSPSMIIVKNRAVSSNWYVGHDGVNPTSPWNYRMILQDIDARTNDGAAWNDTAPTSSVFSIGTSGATNGSGNAMIAYCFSEVAGYSKFGSYTGNGSSSGPTITTGFRPAWVMIKRTDAADSWAMTDNTRTPNNPTNLVLFANLSNAESGSHNIVSFSDTGFQVVGTPTWSNASGGTYIYMAFADTRDAQFNFDASGNKNNWTPNNINSNASSQSTYDLMKDVPTLTSEDAGNYATLNPLDASSSITFSNGNLNYVASTGWIGGRATFAMPSSGKWYWEHTVGGGTISFISALAPASANVYGNGYTNTDVYSVVQNDGFRYSNVQSTTQAAQGHTLVVGDVVCWLVDCDTNTVAVKYNGNTWYTWSQSLNQSLIYSPAFWVHGSYSNSHFFNFGQRPFTYTPPTGYKALNTYNLPDPTIEDGSGYFNTVLYTGTGSSRSVTGIGFQPDLVWIKSRSNAENHNVDDAVRGAGKWLASNLAQAETNDTGSWGVSSFDSDGFSIVNNGTRTNASGYTYVAWNWKANGSGVSNTDGSITSTVSANTSSGFSIISYAGASANSTIGHGLGVAPKMFIVKRRDNYGGSVYDWYTYHVSLGNTKFVRLNTTGASTTFNLWQNTTPSSSVIYLANDPGVNGSGANFVCYAFAPIEGYSAFGSYTGNGSADGPFVYTGFRPAFVMMKRTDTAGGSWPMIDKSRNGFNIQNYDLYANLTQVEATSVVADLLSNGFKLRGTSSEWNGSGNTYIYAAFAENPFKYSLAR
jgi:hypothetical protein